MSAVVQYAAANYTGTVTDLPLLPPVLPVTDYVRRFSALALGQAVGDAVDTWSDIAGSGTSLIPLTTSPRLAQYANGLRAVRFNGASDVLTQDIAIAQPHSVVVLGAFRTLAIGASNIAVMVGSTNTAGAARATLYYDGTNYHTSAGSTGLTGGGTPNTSLHVFQAVFNGSSSALRVDATETTTGNVGTEARSKIAVGGVSGSVWYGNVDVAEILVFNRVLNSTERGLLATALGALAV